MHLHPPPPPSSPSSLAPYACTSALGHLALIPPFHLFAFARNEKNPLFLFVSLLMRSSNSGSRLTEVTYNASSAFFPPLLLTLSTYATACLKSFQLLFINMSALCVQSSSNIPFSFCYSSIVPLIGPVSYNPRHSIIWIVAFTVIPPLLG